MDILVNVANQKLKIATNLKSLVAGTQEFVRFVFNLTGDWDDLLTFAQFRQDGVAYNQYLDEDNSAYLPAEIGTGTCTLMLYGSNDKTIGTTNYITLTIDENILVTDANSTEITESLYNQLVTKVNSLVTWNEQSAADLIETDKNLQIQINKKAEQTDLETEIARAKQAEKANADAIALKASQSDVNDLMLKVSELENNEVVAELIEEAVIAEMEEYMSSGKLSNMTIADSSITRSKVDSDFNDTLTKADSAMQPSVYDPQGLKVDVFSYAKAKADTVQMNLEDVKDEIKDAYKLTDTISYTTLGDAIRGVLPLSQQYAQALLADYKAFTIKIVEELPTTGEVMTFYLVPNDSNTGYDKYWWITDENGDSKWDVFGSSSTMVVTELPETGDADVDYVLKSDAGCLYYKWIDGYWEVVAGSVADIVTELPEEGNEFTDYYLLNEEGSYVHHRWINGRFHVIGGNSYTKDESDTTVSQLRDEIANVQKNVDANATNIESNTANIASLNGTLTALQQEMKNLDVEGYTYYATYGKTVTITGEEKDYVYTLYQCKGDVEEVVSQFVIAGGGAGTGDTTTVTNLVVEKVTSSPVIATPTNKIELEYTYSSTDTDGEEIDGTYTWKLGKNTIIGTGSCIQGTNRFDVTDFVSVGTQKLTLTVVDDGGSVSVKTWTVQIVDVRLESAFSDKITYTAGNAVNFSYTPYGAVSKTVHFILDGEELESVVTSASGISQSYSLPAQSHGAHLLECYITAQINDTVTVETDHIFRDIIWYDEASSVPVIGCIYRYDHYGKVAARQYDSTNIVYHVFDPNTGSPTVEHKADDAVVSTQTMTTTSNTWTYKSDIVGDHTLVISCGETSVTIVMDIKDLGVKITPVTANLEFDFNPTGLSNSSANKLWTDENTGVAMSVSDNFDWNNGGYQLDADGNQYFCVKAGTEAYIDYKLFANDTISTTGAEFKVIFKVTNVRDVDATFLSCVAGSVPVGLRMDAHAAYLMTSGTGADPLYMPYSEDDIIEFEFNVNPLVDEDSTALIMSYEDGTGYRPLLYDSSHRLYQYSSEAAPITIGSPDCDVHIYRMKAYSAFLSDADILSNFIADARDSETMLDRYDRNQIYDENNLLKPDYLSEICPDLKIITIECPHFTKDKKEMIKNSIIQCYHKNGDAALDNWRAINCCHSGQGTTSNEYGYAGRNLNIYMCFDGQYSNKNLDDGAIDPNFITELRLGDGTVYSDGTGKVTLTRTSVENALFNIKVNIASSENANNALLAKRFHRYLPYTTVGERRNPNAKTTMEFVNCVVFIKETDTDMSTHREFQDNEWHFYAIGNIGDSKDTDISRVNDPSDHNEFVVEIADNTFPNSIFPTGVTDSDGKQVYPISESQWVAGNTAYDSLHNGWGDTYEFRYSHPDVTDAEEEANIAIWNNFYKWLITATDEEFTSELSNWFIEESALYMYLFTERYTMLDNRAKNTFWHWGKVYISDAEATAMGETKAAWFTLDNEKAAINNGYRFDFWDYDNDTAIGINNSGEMTQPYGKEDYDYRTDGDPNSGYIFNAAESVFFCRIRDLMYDKLQAMYLSCETAGAWSASGLISEFDAWQEMFPEELWRLDTERKYYRTYQGGGLNGGLTPEPTPRFLVTMMNGRKKYHRRQWERDQEKYMGTKYVGADVKADQIMFRCNTPLTAVVTPNYDLSIIPYSDMYVTVLYGNYNTPMRVRAKAGVEYKIENPLGNSMDDTAILIYCASRIQALNDLSGCYIHDNDFSKASKLQKLIIGNSTEGYSNTFMTELNLGNNALLQELNVRNCPNLVGSVNLSSCGNLETFYAEGTAITGVTFASNGKVSVAYLPDTVNTLVMRNLNYLTDLQLVFDSLETLTEENSIVDELAIVQDAIDTLQTLRLVGINWTLSDTTLLNQILRMNSSSLSGKVYVSGAIRLNELANYAAAWPDLEVTYNSANLVTQYLVTYVNADADATVLYEAYVDRGSLPPDPYAEGWIEKPTMESDAQYHYDFGTSTDGVYDTGSGWDDITGAVLNNMTVVAVYTKSVRMYTVTWYSRAGLSLGSKTVAYGSDVEYDGDIPTNDSEEGMYVYNVFAGWNKSTGYIREDTDVYAIWDRAELPSTDTDLSEMTPGEIYGVTTSGNTANYFTLKDHIDINLGHDFDFENVESEVLAENVYFDGSTAFDKQITLFGENDRSFTMAIDFQFSATTANSTLVSCFEEDGTEGFRLRYSAAPNIQWGDATLSFGSGKMRDIVVLRHVKGDNKLYVYASNSTSSGTHFDLAITRAELTRSRSTNTSAIITLGAIRFMADGGYDDYGTGFVHWCKIWHDDLGEANCRKLAAWCHEPLRMEFYGEGLYRLSGGTSQRSNASFICNHLLGSRTQQMNTSNTNVGGWDATKMRTFLANRIYPALPTVWQSMIKQVKINASAGNKSTEILISDDYVYIPSLTEMNNSKDEPYVSEGTYISWFTSDPMRLKYKGILVPDDSTYYSDASDPSTNTAYDIQPGDRWKKSGGQGYVYVSQDYVTKYGITPDVTASIGGGWVSASNWWLRSPYVGSTAHFWYVHNNGGLNGSSNASYSHGVCPCFSI